MAKSKFSVTGKLKQELDQDDLLDLFKETLAQDGEIFDFEPRPDGSCAFKAAPNSTMHGVKGVMTPKHRNNETTISIEGRIVMARWLWYIVHVVVTLIFLPYAIFAVSRALKSWRLAGNYGQDLIRKMRSESSVR